MQLIFSKPRKIADPSSNFLFQRSCEDIIDRLSYIKRPFTNAVVLGKGYAPIVDYLQEHRKSQVKVIPFEEFDFSTLPLQWPSVDLIVANMCLHWVNDLPGLLWQIRKALNPDGLFVGSMFGGETLCELRQTLLATEHDLTNKVYPRVIPMPSLFEVTSLLGRCDFTMPVADRDMLVVEHVDLLSLLKELKNMGETNVMFERCKTLTSKNLFSTANARASSPFKSTVEIFYLSGWSLHDSQQKPLTRGCAQRSMVDILSGN